MQSGTILHLALLRKTSNAKKRNFGKKTKLSNFKLQPLSQDNFTLTGWSIEQNEFKQEIQKQKLSKLKQIETDKKQLQSKPLFTDITNEKRTIQTSDNHARRQNFSASQVSNRNYKISRGNFQLYRQIDMVSKIQLTEPSLGTKISSLKKGRKQNLPQSFQTDYNQLQMADKIQQKLFHDKQSLGQWKKYANWNSKNLGQNMKLKKRANEHINRLNICYTGTPKQSEDKTIICLRNSQYRSKQRQNKSARPGQVDSSKNNKQSFSNFLYSKAKNERKYRRL